MRVMSGTRPSPGPDWGHSLFCLTLLLWTRRMSGLTDFSNYLSRIISSHSAHACDGQPLRLHCPRHSTISVQSAFYGSGAAWPCGSDETRPGSPPGVHNYSCSAFTALQKLLSECQSHRDCRLPVNHLLFGKDPCPGTTKYLHVDYKCKPTEHKRHLVCEGDTMVLRCKPPRVLNIYAAVYGRGLDHGDICPSHRTRPPPFECLNHEAVHLVTRSCYSKQQCAVSVSNRTFRDPCFPGTRKYLSVVYSCVPQSLLKEVDPNVLGSPSSPTVNDLEDILSDGQRRAGSSGAVMSDSLLTYAYIKEHSEMAALIFTSSVCMGLLLTLLAVSLRVTCRGRRPRDPALASGTSSRTVVHQQNRDHGGRHSVDEDSDGSLISAAKRKAAIYGWEEVTYVSEAAERAERIERRDMIIQEIWMNAYLNGNAAVGPTL